MASDFPPKDPKDTARTTQRGTIPPLTPMEGVPIARIPTINPADGIPRTSIPLPAPGHTPTAVPAVRDRIRSTPIPVNVERFIQQLLSACAPLGNPERFVREMLLEGLASKVPEMIRGKIATRTTALVASNLLRILADGEQS